MSTTDKNILTKNALLYPNLTKQKNKNTLLTLTSKSWSFQKTSIFSTDHLSFHISVSSPFSRENKTTRIRFIFYIILEIGYYTDIYTLVLHAQCCMYRRMIRFLQFGLQIWFVHQTQSLLHSALQGCFAWFEWAGLPFGVARGAVSQTREPQQRTYPTATEWAGSWMVVPWHLQALPFASDCENRRPEIRYSVFLFLHLSQDSGTWIPRGPTLDSLYLPFLQLRLDFEC